MKKQLLLIVMTLLPMVAMADPVVIDGIYYNLVSKVKQAEVTKKPSGKYSGSIVIPSVVTYNGEEYSVTSIGDDAFQDCSGLTSVTIPNSVTSIGGYAFYDCSGLTSVHITDIEAWCNISFKYGVSNPLYWAHHIFMNGSEITHLDIPNSVTRISRLAFYGCSGLTSVIIGNSVKSIGGWAFADCTGLTSITIPNSVTSIGYGAFHDCSGLTSISIGENVASIDQEAFWGCTGLTLIESFNPNPPQCPLDNTFGKIDFTIPLYIPSGSYLKYKAAVGWRQFVVMREMGGDSDVYLSIYDGSHGNVNIKVDENNPCMTLKFEPDNGWHLYSVKLNDEDVTAEVGQDGKYTTPAINTNSKLTVVYAQGASSAPSINANRIDLSSNDNELIVSGTTGGERIAVYTMNGVCVSNTVATGKQTTIPLATRQTYIVKVNDLVMKYCY